MLKDADAYKFALDALNEMGLTNVLGVALPDTRNLSSEQVQLVIGAGSAAGACSVAGSASASASTASESKAARQSPSPPPTVASRMAQSRGARFCDMRLSFCTPNTLCCCTC